MTDLEKAKLLLENQGLTLVVVKDGEIIFKSKERGIKPMFILATELKEKARGGVLADRVIGKGGAILSGYIGIKELYSKLISQAGIERLEYYNIPYSMDRSCEYIKNRSKTDYCPIEKISMNIENPIVLIEAIKEFFKEMGKGEI